MSQAAAPTAPTIATGRSSTLAIAAAFAIVGLAFVYLSGFANSAVLHNAAHDSRHALVFPCH